MPPGQPCWPPANPSEARDCHTAALTIAHDPGVYDDRPALVQDRDVPDDRGLVEDLPGHEDHRLP
jgi:hypothetical protein